jgi:hypothetical protein
VGGLRGARGLIEPCFPIPSPEVHCHVHGPLHGRLEHRVSRLQLAAAAGTSQHVTRSHEDTSLGVAPWATPSPVFVFINAFREAEPASAYCLLVVSDVGGTRVGTVGLCPPPASATRVTKTLCLLKARRRLLRASQSAASPLVYPGQLQALGLWREPLLAPGGGGMGQAPPRPPGGPINC